jgi:3-oxoacyl-[acyl-carrier protein] reductase
VRRWGTPEEVANLVCFLSSDKAAYITGALIEVTGGKFATQMPWVAHRE